MALYINIEKILFNLSFFVVRIKPSFEPLFLIKMCILRHNYVNNVFNSNTFKVCILLQVLCRTLSLKREDIRNNYRNADNVNLT